MHILNEAGHYCYREQPEGFTDAVTSYLARHATGP
jgi:pimeloyl-ACP methyl ester carboxylesterase